MRIRPTLWVIICGLVFAIAVASLPAAAQTFVPTGSMNSPRGGHSATLLDDGKVLIAGGAHTFVAEPGAIYASAELYDPATGTFTATSSMNSPRYRHTATLLNNRKVLITGGYIDFTGGNPFTASAELYDPDTGTFTPIDSMNSVRADHTATLLDSGKVLIAGGCISGLPYCLSTASAELFDPATGTFTPTGNMNFIRTQHTSTLLNDGRALIVGGWDWTNNQGWPVAEIYDPATGTFSAAGYMIDSRDRHTATLLGNGKVLIAGGWSNRFGYTVIAELYDPVTESFTATGLMNRGRLLPTATVLNNGMVFVAGGWSGSGWPHQTTERYDPTAGAFTLSGDMTTDRYIHTATLLNNGRVLLAGGYSGATAWLASAELFVSNQPPVAAAGPNQTAIVAEVLTFDGSASSDPDGSIVAYLWDFGDGYTASDAVTTHSFAAAGSYTVTLTVTDDAGATAADTAVVTVKTVSQAIGSLSGLVASFNLKQGISNSLDAKLQNALEAYQAANAGNRQDVVNKLMAFTNAVEAQRGKELTSAQADQLIAEANRILSVL